MTSTSLLRQLANVCNLLTNRKVPQWEGLCKKINLTMKEFVELEKSDSKKEENVCGEECSRWMYFDYKYMNEWFSDHQSLLNAVSWKNFGFPEREGSVSTIWIGNDGAHTPCHLDTYGCNLVAQVYGRKQWILFPPERTSSLLPTRTPYEESSIYSNLNFYSPDPNMADELQEACVVTLKPGDVLFVPHHWWHYVENVGTAVSVNSWIPLPSDDESRLEEALVRFFVSQVCKDLPEHKLHQLLNPNEADLVDHPLSITAQQIEICVDECQQNRTSVREMDPGVGDQDDDTNVKKRPRLAGQSDVYDCGQTLASSNLTQEEVLNKFKDVISVVPKYSASEFRSLLIEKQKSFSAQAVEDVLSEGATDVDSNRLQHIINAFCHPEVISKIKDKILIQE
ncbi:HSPB1-associated protein 1 isoform X2 [Zootermopsis nevadensis]|uniref:HSPB1-associated protein 1 isoform X2 n=1 Tax=Zootermopsis nevadensis TaxID=136037 RepID=UPI000B8EB52D|nr:HSPB1-associated protein 1 isoform X2 [Zootermopsis nevadensis]